MSDFLETLSELMADHRLNVRELSEQIRCNPSAIRRWFYENFYPEPKTLIRLAIFFDTSVDYMFGRSDKKEISRNCNTGRFFDKYLKLKKEFKVTDYRVSKECDLRGSTVSKWRTIQSFPETDSLIKLADFFGCSMDYLLGISKER